MCANWIDRGFEPPEGGTGVVGYGCLVSGPVGDFARACDCPSYAPQREPQVTCGTCRLAVPRVCVLLGECANCVDTDMFCLSQCAGGEWKRLCSHWNRLESEGKQLVVDGVPQSFHPQETPAEPPPHATLGEMLETHHRNRARELRPRGR